MQRISLIAIAIVLIAVFKTSHSCFCEMTSPDPQQDFDRAQAVFIGQAINVTEDARTKQGRVLFKARRVFKSPNCSKTYFVIHAESVRASSCGLWIQQGDWWQIWAYGNSSELGTSLCSPSTKDLTAYQSFLRSQTCS